MIMWWTQIYIHFLEQKQWEKSAKRSKSMIKEIIINKVKSKIFHKIFTLFNLLNHKTTTYITILHQILIVKPI